MPLYNPAAPAGPWQPSDDGFLGSNSDPASASGGGLLVATNLYLARIVPRAAQTITNLWVCVTAAGATTSTGTFVGLYPAAGGSPLSISADCAAAFTGTTGWKSIALTTPQPVAAGTAYYAAVLCNLNTTQVTLLRQLNTVNNSPQVSVNVATERWSQQAGFSSTTMGSVTLASNAATGFSNIFLWN